MGRTRGWGAVSPSPIRGALLLILVLAVLSPTVGSAPTWTTVVREGQEGFRIRGRVWGLFPGAQRSMPLRLYNPQPYDITVTSLSGEPTRANRSGCPPDMVEIDPLESQVSIPGKSWIPHALVVRLAAEAPDACQRAKFTIEFTGTAVDG
jgi:hypothetical protein